MSSPITRPYTTPSNYTYDDTKIEVSGGVAQLILNDNTGQTFDETYNGGDTGFTYDSNKAEYVDYHTNTTLGVNFTVDEDGNFGSGVLTGTLTTATISSGELDCTGGGVKYCTWPGLDNADHAQVGTIRFHYRPNYTTTGGSNYALCANGKNGTNNSRLFMYHDAADNIQLNIRNSSGVNIVNASLGSWTPTLDQRYEFLISYDLTAGATRVFIEGTQQGSTQTDTGTRSASDLEIMVLGSDQSGGTSAKGKFDNLLVYDVVKYTANYTAGYNVPNYSPIGSFIQKDLFPAGFVSWSSFEIDENLSGGGGTLTPRAFNGEVSSGWCNLAGGNKKVEYYNENNFDYALLLKGSIRFKIKFNYSGAPNEYEHLYCSDVGGLPNRIHIRLLTAGQIYVEIYDFNGLAQIQDALSWTPSSGTKYEFLYCWDLTPASERTDFFINGTRQAALSTTGEPCVRTSSFVKDYITIQGRSTNGFQISDLVCYDTNIKTANYTPGYTVPDARYETSKVELPTMTYPDVGALQAFTSFSTEDTNTPKYVMNDLYYNSGWVASDGSWSQSSTEADVLANIASLPASDTMNIDVVFNNSNDTQQDANDLTLTYTGQLYPTTNPVIKFNETTNASELLSFAATATATGSDAVKYAIEINGTDYWYNGSLQTSSGYSETNTKAEIIANIASFVTARSAFRLVVYLHSDNGQTTPNIDTYTFIYDASLPDVSPTMIDVNGFDYLGSVPDEDRVVKYRPYLIGFINEGVQYTYDWKTLDTVDPNGFFSGDIPKNPSSTFWEVKIGKQSYKITLENTIATFVNWANLNPVAITEEE